MRTRRSTTAFALVALLALIGLGSALAEESFVHTDDGCAVEIHCLACRLSVGGAAVFGAVPVVAPTSVAVATLSVPTLLAARTVSPRLFQSRAPPLA